MDLTAALRSHGGYRHRSDLIEQGWRADTLRAAVLREEVLVVRRFWLLLPGSPPHLVAAARAGARLACVSAGSVLGLWRPGHDTTGHFSMPPHSGSAAPDGIIHRAVGPIAAAPRSLIDPVENILARAATCLPFDDALAVWESALRTKTVARAHLARVPWTGPVARRLAATAGTLSHSGLETLACSRLRRRGIVMVQQVRVEGHDVDGLIGARLVLQLDGFEHHRDARQRRSDIAHDRRLRLLGYTVLRYDYHEIVNEWPRVEAEIIAAVAQGLHLARPA